MKLRKTLVIAALGAVMLPALNSCCGSRTELVTEPVDYATTLMGTLSEFALSTGNTYPATAGLRPVRDNAGEGRLQGK